MKLQNFRFHESGLNRFFGSLEAKIMEIIWNGSDLTIKDVQLELEKEKATNFNTVMTVMNRLVEKGILQKTLKGRVSLYRPVLSKEQFLEEQSKEITHELIDEFGMIVVNHMLDALEEADPVLLDQLEQKIKAMKKDK